MSHNHIFNHGHWEPIIICNCSLEQYNSIAKLEGSRGRTTTKIGLSHFIKPKLLGYTENVKEQKKYWWLEAVCPICEILKVMQVQTYNKSKSCRECSNIGRGKVWDILHYTLYDKWVTMKARCYKADSENYSEYGAKGITVCKEWQDNFHSFQDWCLKTEPNYKARFNKGDKLQIHRINDAMEYGPTSCKLLSTNAHLKLHRWGYTYAD